MTAGTLPYVDLLDPALDPAGPEMLAARRAHWCARTPMGLAVLRYRALAALLSDRRLAQGSHLLLTHQGITEGPVAEWMNTILLTIEGEDHTRLRKLVSRAFTTRAVEALRPVMRRLADELIDGFAADGRVELMAAFADPWHHRTRYAADQVREARMIATCATSRVIWG